MSLLKSVTTGIIKRPHYILMHGMPGIGKSTFASTFPKPIFLCAEKGTANLNVTRLEMDTFGLFEKALTELFMEAHDYQTIILDTVDHIEPLIFKEVAKEHKKDSIEDIGYAKGYIFALEYWMRLITLIEVCREKRGMNIVLLAHTEVKPHNDPQLPEPYDTYRVKLHSKAANLLVDRVECVLFANYLTGLDDKGLKTKAYGDGSRTIYTEFRPAFTAKNRFDLPFSIKFDESFGFKEFDALCNPEKTAETPELVKQQIAELIKEVKDKATIDKVEQHVKAVGNDLRKLIAAKNKLKLIVAA